MADSAPARADERDFGGGEVDAVREDGERGEEAVVVVDARV